MRVLTLVGLLSTLALPAWAARPFVTDDARLTTAGSCQLESWVRTYPQSRETWALPACNPGGNLELTVGGGWARYDDAPATKDQVFQLKTLFRPLETNGWGWGLAVGTVRHPEINPGPNLLGNTYAYVPVSASFLDDRAIVHANLGWLRDKATRRDNATWGIGGEYALNTRVSAIAETFGDNRSKPYWQTGARVFIVPERVQVDATVGRQFSGTRAGQWFSIGLRLTPDKLF
ncbi:MAG: hypothetical protein Q7U97_10435 [Rhodocyclaceae bacterium]|nr:hypothetical protein [Rhodocyclaceae bacterium]